MIIQQQLDDARADMIFREEQLHNMRDVFGDMHLPLAWKTYDKARDAYLQLLMEYRVAQLKEVPA